MINILIPMAGEGQRFVDAGYDKPKPFIDVLGKPMIEWVLENLAIQNAKYYLVAKKQHLEREKLTVNALEKKYPVKFVPVDLKTEGTACTVLFAREFINNGEPLLIANSDQLITGGIESFLQDAGQRELDGSILTFNSNETKWSYARTDSDGLVTQVKEKVVISNNATCGIYYFSKGSYFVESAIDMIIRNDRVNNEFYTCPVYNYLILRKKRVGIFPIEEKQMWGLGTPEDLTKFVKSTSLAGK